MACVPGCYPMNCCGACPAPPICCGKVDPCACGPCCPPCGPCDGGCCGPAPCICPCRYLKRNCGSCGPCHYPCPCKAHCYCTPPRPCC